MGSRRNRPSRLRIKSAMTGWRTHASFPVLWIPAYAGMTVRWDCLAITLTFDSSSLMGEGIIQVVLSCCCPAPHLWIADQVRNDGVGFVVELGGFEPPTSSMPLKRSPN